MKAYIDSSVVLRIIFGEQKPLSLNSKLEYTIASDVLKIECFRTLDRMRHSLLLSDDDVAARSALLHRALKTIRFIKLSNSISQRASQGFPTVVKTLDAIHLATALLWQSQENAPLCFLTHDVHLGKTARAVGLEVLGC